MLQNLSSYNIILGSNSPRRKELLEQLGISFSVKKLNGIDESFPSNLRGADAALYIVGKKSAAFLPTMNSDDMVITADTIVCIGDMILGKPADRDDAVRMLQMLSGKTHQVVTAVGIRTCDKNYEFAVTTEVRFATLSDEMINYYVDNFCPYDKAGSYGIQEWIGYVGVESVNGSFFNVIGLPVQRLFKELQKF